MKRYTGTLQQVDLGAGGWALDLEDGGRVLLDGDVPSGLEGRRVVVRGHEAARQGFLMTGDAVVVIEEIREGG